MFNGVLRNLLASQTDDIAKQAIKTSASKSVLNKVLPTTSIASKVSPKADDVLELLKQEALNYNNVDDFIKTHGDLFYHGSKSKYNQFDFSKADSGGLYGNSAYLTNNLNRASSYGDNITEYIVPRNAKLLKESEFFNRVNSIEPTIPYRDIKIAREKAVKQLIKEGYDGVRTNDTTAIFNPNALHSKQQLNDLYNQAHSENLPLSLEKPLSIDYGMSHRPTRTGATADNITQDVSDMGLPSDFYDHPEWYANMREPSYIESMDALRKIRNNPDAEVTIYRASPKNQLNEGDWITLSPAYAKGESLAEGTPVHSFKVKAREIQFAGDDINEFGYWPGGGFDE